MLYLSSPKDSWLKLVVYSVYCMVISHLPMLFYKSFVNIYIQCSFLGKIVVYNITSVG